MIRRRLLVITLALVALVGSAAPALGAAPGLPIALTKTDKSSPKLLLVIGRQTDPDFPGAPGGGLEPAP